MKRLIAALALWVLGMGLAPAQGSPAEAIVMDYYGALKAGDVDAVRALIGEPLAGQYQVLLTENTQYPEILRAHYAGSTGEVVGSGSAAEGEASVDFEVMFKDGTKSTLRFNLRGQDDGSWKIVEEERVN